MRCHSPAAGDGGRWPQASNSLRGSATEHEMNRDGKNHLYVDVDNVRVTYVPASDREQAADWSGQDVLRVQAYRGTGDRSLHMGAELPVSSPDVFVRLVGALCAVFSEGRHGSAQPPSKGSRGDKGTTSIG